jgi:hypothetical protein
MRALALAAALSAAGTTAWGHPSPGQPFATARLVQRFGGERELLIRGRWTEFVGVPDPTLTGASVTVTAASGSAVVLHLPRAGWLPKRGYRYLSRPDTGGSTRARLRLGRRGGHFVLRDTTGRVRLAPGTTSVAVRVHMGDIRWCAEATAGDVRESPRRWRARIRETPRTCPCPPLPTNTLEAIRQRVFERHTCSVPGCHGSAPGQGGLFLATSDLHGQLVGVPSQADPETVRVAPGDPDRSMLWLKLAGRTLGIAGVPGTAMPIGEPAVDAHELDAIREWILAGAPATGTIERAQALLHCAWP